jgi:hypothetical protein
MSKKVTIPADLREELAGANGDPVVLCDDAGNVVGYAVTPGQLPWLAPPAPADPWTPEEIARAIERSKNDTRPKRTMAEVLKLVEGD